MAAKSGSSWKVDQLTREALAKEIRRNLRTFPDQPCRAARIAVATLGMPIGVRGDDDEKGLDHIELWDRRDNKSLSFEPVLSLDLENGKWRVRGVA